MDKTLEEYSTPLPTNIPNPSTTKRRKLRKRKRRPQKTSYEEQTNYEITRPQRLDEFKQIWDVMELGQISKPYSRRRLTPDYYYPTDEIKRPETTTSGTVFQEIRDPYKALQEVEGKTKKTIHENQNNTPDLKTVLKKTEGTLSLSEILQQKNLTLSDLLKGGSKAITALRQATDIKNKTNNKQHKKKDEEQNVETDIRNFTPSDRKMNDENSTEQSKIKNKLPITSAKLHKLHKHPLETTQKNLIDIPPKAIQINVNDIFGFSAALSKNKNASKVVEEGPSKMIIDLEQLTTTENNSAIKTSTENSITTTATTTTTTEKKHLQVKLKIKTAKDEILDFINDEVNKENISEILESRNMTLTELIELRERGSSQRHLLDIFQNKTETNLMKNKTEEPYIEKIKTFFQHASGRRGKSQNVSIVNSENSEEERHKEQQNVQQIVQQTVRQTVQQKQLSVTSFPVYKVEIDKDTKQNQNQMPFWKSIHPNPIEETFQNNNQNDLDFNNNNSIQETEIGDYENALHSITHDKLNVEINSYEDDEENEDVEDFFNWPTGLKSALFASLAIIGASLMIFLSILFVFKWSQKTKRKLCYHASNIAVQKIKSPALIEQPKRTIRTIMCETIGRKNAYWKTKQSMSDTIWNNNRIPFQ